MHGGFVVAAALFSCLRAASSPFRLHPARCTVGHPIYYCHFVTAALLADCALHYYCQYSASVLQLFLLVAHILATFPQAVHTCKCPQLQPRPDPREMLAPLLPCLTRCHHGCRPR